MGQYYKPCILKEDKKTVESFMYSHEYNNGLKLMEHSYLDNDFVSTFENLLINKPQRVCWAGDYADNCKDEDKNLYTKCVDDKKINPEVKTINHVDFKYIVNHSKKQYIDKSKIIEDNYGYKIHPLPLMTCEGNGRGGGDFRGNSGFIGTWSRDLISIESEKPKGYKEIIFDLKEE